MGTQGMRRRVDGVTTAQYEAEWEANLTKLLERFKSGWHRAPAARRVHDGEAGDRGDALHKDTNAGGRGAGVRARRRCDAGAGEADMDGRGVREARHLIYTRGFARGCSWSPHSPRRAHTPVDEETAPLLTLAHYHVPGESHCLSTETG